MEEKTIPDKNRIILVISVDNDTITDEICRWLSYQNKQFLRFSENMLINSLYFDFQKDNYLVSIDDEILNLNEVTSVYYRNGVVSYKKIDQDIDLNLAKFYNSEIKETIHFIFYYLSQLGVKIYGNLSQKKVNKLEVLHKAKQLGFITPESIITTELTIVENIVNSKKSIITKSISEVQPVFVETGMYLNYTKEVYLSDLEGKNQNLIPTLLQEKINREYEIRVFFFQKKIWSVACFDSTEEIDNRKGKEITKKYSIYELPQSIKNNIYKLSNSLGLMCGTLDFIKSKDKYYFLEINPLGQFHNISILGNFQIEKYIADLL
ncbi:ATP-grasp domain-containing protein [Amniculibacterium aquaticum]|uniref:hypothetical protein n=1 Tax=Amniculibacterium aquaticum TaxID=2479858 RepID=UPI000F5A3E8F|nr:hypothetical protein [Amniculibacterium aquaticum]